MTHSIEQYFNKKALDFGPTHKAVGWGSKERQTIRFSRIFHYIQRTSGTLLDVGCGIGDFYDFLLTKKGLGLSYLGIDISREMITLANGAYPGGNFHVESLEHHKNDYDVVVACGTFNMFQTGGHEEYLKQSLLLLLSRTRQMCCVSMLSDKCKEKQSLFYYANVEVVQRWIPSLWTVTIDDSYLDNDVLFCFKKKQGK